jgi:hypothetical protein
VNELEIKKALMKFLLSRSVGEYIKRGDNPEDYVFNPKFHKAEFVPPKPVGKKHKEKHK